MPRPRVPALARPAESKVPRVSGIVGLVALGFFSLGPAGFLVGELIGSEIFIYVGVFGCALISFVAGIVAVSLAVYSRLNGPWAIVGLITGMVSILFSAAGALSLLLML